MLISVNQIIIDFSTWLILYHKFRFKEIE